MPSADVLRHIDQLLAAAFGRYSDQLSPTALAEPLESLVRYLVNQRTTHAMARRALAAARAVYPTWAALAAASQDHLADLLRPAGMADAKAARLQAALRQVYLDHKTYSLAAIHQWPTKRVLRYLGGLPGAGPHTAALVALFALRRRGVFPVEAAIQRVARKLLWVSQDSGSAQVRLAVETAGVDMDLTDLHVNLIRVGRRHCRAHTTDCWHCPLVDVCPSRDDAYPA